MHVVNNNIGGGGGGGATFSKVVLREVKMLFVPDLVNIQDSLNQLTVTVAAGEVIFPIVSHFINGVDGAVSIAKYAFKNNQATTTFGPENPIDKNDLIYIGEINQIDLMLGGTTQLIDLGDIGSTPIQDYVNTTGPYEIQLPAVGDRVFAIDLDGVVQYYYFLPTGGMYGDGQTQTTAANFAPFDTRSTGLQTVLYQGNRPIMWINSTFEEVFYTAVPADKARHIAGRLSGEYNQNVIINRDVFKQGDVLVITNAYVDTSLNNFTPMYVIPGERTSIYFANKEYVGFLDDPRIAIPPGYTAYLTLIDSEQDTEEETFYDKWVLNFLVPKTFPRSAKGFITKGPSTPISDPPLIKGETYEIIEYGEGDDFTMSGAANNDAGTIFIANGVPPIYNAGSVLLGSSNLILDYEENNLGFEPGFEIDGYGTYRLTSDGLFSESTKLVITNPDFRLISAIYPVTDSAVQFTVRSPYDGDFVDNFTRTPFYIEI